MSAEEELAEALAFFAETMKAGLFALDRRLGYVEERMMKLDPTFHSPDITDLRKDIEEKYGDLLK